MGDKYLKVGDVIWGKGSAYIVVDYIGKGGMAQVYRGIEKDDNTPVAIKVIKKEQGHSDLYSREFVILRSLYHDYIVKLIDFISSDDYVYIIMEYLPGKTLKDHLKTDRKIDLISDIIKIALALDFAHSNGIIHRDIKPANILYDANREPRLTDFGISVNAFFANVTSKYAGTPAYMAPEQLKGEPIDPRTDIYQLGLILYEILTGHLPFTPDDTREFLEWINKSLIHNPSLYEPQITPAFGKLFMKAITTNREKRFKSAKDFAIEIVKASIQSGYELPHQVMKMFDEMKATISIYTIPSNAFVKIDTGEKILEGITPYQEEKVFPGSHRISVKMPMFSEMISYTWVEPGEMFHSDIILDPSEKTRHYSDKEVEDVVFTQFGIVELRETGMLVKDTETEDNIYQMPYSHSQKKMFVIGRYVVLTAPGEDLKVIDLYKKTMITGERLSRVFKVGFESSKGIVIVEEKKTTWVNANGEIHMIGGSPAEEYRIDADTFLFRKGHTIFVKKDAIVSFEVPYNDIISVHLIPFQTYVVVETKDKLITYDFFGNIVNDYKKTFEGRIKKILTVLISRGRYQYYFLLQDKILPVSYKRGLLIPTGKEYDISEFDHFRLTTSYLVLGQILAFSSKEIGVISLKEHLEYKSLFKVPLFKGKIEKVSKSDPYLTVRTTKGDIHVFNLLSVSSEFENSLF